MSWTARIFFGLAAAVPGCAYAHMVPVPEAPRAMPPALVAPMPGTPLAVRVEVAPQPPSAAPNVARQVPESVSNSTMAAAAASRVSVDVQVVPPPEEPKTEASDADCHDNDALNNVDNCEGSSATNESSQDATQTGNETYQNDTYQEDNGAIDLPPASEPASPQQSDSGISGWWIAGLIVLAALILGWISSKRRR